MIIKMLFRVIFFLFILCPFSNLKGQNDTLKIIRQNKIKYVLSNSFLGANASYYHYLGRTLFNEKYYDNQVLLANVDHQYIVPEINFGLYFNPWFGIRQSTSLLLGVKAINHYPAYSSIKQNWGLNFNTDLLFKCSIKRFDFILNLGLCYGGFNSLYKLLDPITNIHEQTSQIIYSTYGLKIGGMINYKPFSFLSFLVGSNFYNNTMQIQYYYSGYRMSNGDFLVDVFKSNDRIIAPFSFWNVSLGVQLYIQNLKKK